MTIQVPIGVIISPTSVGVTVGASLQFGATVAGTLNKAVNWTLSGAACGSPVCGTISPTGLYVAPLSVPSPATVTVTATSVADSTKSASAVVTVQPTNNSKLSSFYAFLFKGYDILGVYQAAGSFQSDGNGHLTGVEDINRSTGVSTNVAFTGTYQVGADNRGTMTLTSAQGKMTFAFALGSTAKKGRLVSFDNSGIRGSGILRQQDPSDFNTFALANPYTLNLTGQAFDGRVGMLADIIPSGDAFVAGSTMDYNDNANTQQFTGFNGAYTVDVNGRGTLTLNVPQDFQLGQFGVMHFALYVVSAQELILVSTDTLNPFNAIIAGVGEQQTGGGPFLPSSFNGNSVFNLVGNNSGLAQAFVGRINFDGVSVANVQSDENKNGAITIDDLFTATYTVAPSGRGILTKPGFPPTTWLFYAISPNRAFVMDISPLVLSGEMKSELVTQFSDADVVGQFAEGSGEPQAISADLLSGVSAFDGGGTVSGAQDLSQQFGQTPNQTLGGTYAVGSFGGGNGRGTILLNSPGSSTIALWLISSSEFVALDVDNGNLEPTVLFFEQ